MSQNRYGQGASMRLLSVVAPIVFAWVCAEAAVSILAHWPYQFTGQGTPNQMLRDFVFSGTVLAPPLPLLLVFGATTVFVGREDRLGAIANAAMIAACAVMAVGSLGEVLAPTSPDVPRAVQLAGGVLGVVVFVALAAVALKALAERHATAEI